jgi:hypothetical protein
MDTFINHQGNLLGLEIFRINLLHLHIMIGMREFTMNVIGQMPSQESLMLTVK